MECDVKSSPVIPDNNYFNQRTRMECDIQISINALAWSATAWTVGGRWGRWISINALAWSATPTVVKPHPTAFISINALAWSATIEEEWNKLAKVISINALAWSATPCVLALHLIIVYFNQRTRMECDGPWITECCYSFWFQSTHSHGVRLAEYTDKETENVFQSTHSHGVRPYAQTLRGAIKIISINALAWSATGISMHGTT